MKTRSLDIRQARAREAVRIHQLIAGSVDEGHLLPRTLADVTEHAHRFVVAMRGRRLVGCAELAPLSPQVAEVRSLVVHEAARHFGVASCLVQELRAQARRSGFEQLCAFTHAPGLFTRLGFSLVPHRWLPEKIAADCMGCSQFRKCGQAAMVLPLDTHDHAVRDERPSVLRAL
jgi:amino-acid N-acetyltransferase